MLWSCMYFNTDKTLYRSCLAILELREINADDITFQWSEGRSGTLGSSWAISCMISTLPPRSLLPPFSFIWNRGVQRASLCTFLSSGAVGYDSASDNRLNGFFVDCEWRRWREMMHKICHPGEVSSHQHFGVCDKSDTDLDLEYKYQQSTAWCRHHHASQWGWCVWCQLNITSSPLAKKLNFSLITPTSILPVGLGASHIPFMWFPVFHLPMKLWLVKNLANSCLQSFSFSPTEAGNS